ncbi:MAG TPA: hypothetical protein VE130_10530 [Nitrososphaeraceae archaeon]|nr:hypothetical protein [Nitrososphaeraceae archaeon]
MTTKKNTTKAAARKEEIQHLKKVFGNKLENYSHTGYQRAELPYTVRDAAAMKKRKSK